MELTLLMHAEYLLVGLVDFWFWFLCVIIREIKENGLFQSMFSVHCETLTNVHSLLFHCHPGCYSFVHFLVSAYLFVLAVA